MKRDHHTRAKATALLQFVGVGLTNAETEYLMKVLRLPLSYFAAVQQVVAEGRWRTAKDPVNYVRTAAWRTATADAEWDQPKGLPVSAGMSHDEFIDSRTSWDGPTKRDGVWYAGSSYDDEDYWGDGLTPGERLRNRVPDRFCFYWPSSEERAELETHRIPLPVDPIRVPDWAAIAKTAGLDAGETEVLNFMASGVSRDRALASLHGPKRKEIQAAWRRFSRNRCLQRVAAVLSGPA